jgi:hypothetical protein
MTQEADFNRPQLYPARLLTPAVPCPNCGKPVQGFVSCKMEDDNWPVGQHAYASTVPPDVLQARMTWTLYPCYCKVDQFWASSFAEEMGLREKGHAPLPVHGLSRADRNAKRKEIEGKITALYKKRDAALAAGMSSRIKALERDIVVQIQHLCVVLPGAHNTLPALNLSKEVAEWAGHNNLRLPPGNEQNAVAGANITVNDIRLLLAVDPGYQSMPAGMILRTAQEMYDQLAAFAAKGTPMHAKSIAAIAKLIPNADQFLPSRTVDAADDPDPRISFAKELVKRPIRKVTRLKRNKSGEDIDE